MKSRFSRRVLFGWLTGGAVAGQQAALGLSRLAPAIIQEAKVEIGISVCLEASEDFLARIAGSLQEAIGTPLQ